MSGRGTLMSSRWSNRRWVETRAARTLLGEEAIAPRDCFSRSTFRGCRVRHPPHSRTSFQIRPTGSWGSLVCRTWYTPSNWIASSNNRCMFGSPSRRSLDSRARQELFMTKTWEGAQSRGTKPSRKDSKHFSRISKNSLVLTAWRDPTLTYPIEMWVLISRFQQVHSPKLSSLSVPRENRTSS